MEDYSGNGLIQNPNELHGLLLSEETLDSTLQRVAELALTTVDGCESAGVTMIDNARATTAAATDDFTLKIDKDQYENREGPCLQAVATQEVVLAEDITTEERWPRFARAATKDGLGSVLSLPLAVRDEPIGSLNLYSRKVRAFGETDEPLGRLFASQASVAISNAQVYASALRVADQLNEAIKTREVIGEAKGILMAQEGVTDDEAFEMLKRVSQNQNVKLREIAQRIVDEAVKKGGDRP